MEILIRSQMELQVTDVEEALRAFYQAKGRSVCVQNDRRRESEKSLSSTGTDSEHSVSGDIIVSPFTQRGPSEDRELEEMHSLLDKISTKLDQKESECRESTDKASKAMATVQTFHAQQKEMFEEFRILRERYDEQKAVLQDILWKHCARFHPDLKAIPPMESDDFPETETEVGNFTIGGVLGEGQFATVMNCVRKGSSADGGELALKVINKEKIMSFNSLRHVSNEIEILKSFKCNHIIRIEDILQTTNRLYIVTEKGGLDMFEFFDEHPDGVSEEWAREIISCVLRGVHYIHRQGICHRDLKPENILVTFDAASGRCLDLKLCDFGLASKFEPNTYLHDFCGSPGFFAPEMIIRGSYYGDKADIWSCGCILLELTLGHEKFCDTWMTAYDYEILQDKAVFAKEIRMCIERLSDSLTFSHELNEFIVRFLRLRSSLRPNIADVCHDPWLGEMGLDSDGQTVPGRASPELLAVTNRHSLYGIEDALTNTEVDPDIIRSSFNSLSERERKLYDTHNKHVTQSHEGHGLHLPPIEPPTPNMSAARKILRKGEQLVTSTQHQDSDRWSVSPTLKVAPLITPATGPDSPESRSSPYAPIDSPVMRMGKMLRPSLPDVGEHSGDGADEESVSFGGASSDVCSTKSHDSRRRGSSAAAERAALAAAELADEVDEDIRRDSVDVRASTRSKIAEAAVDAAAVAAAGAASAGGSLEAAGDRLPQAVFSPRTPRSADAGK